VSGAADEDEDVEPATDVGDIGKLLGIGG